MKRTLYIFLMALTMSLVHTTKSDALSYYFKTVQFAIKYKNTHGWDHWSDWKDSDMRAMIDLDDDVIVIYSKMTQVYQVVNYLGASTDESGGKQMKFKVIDQDNDIGHARWRVDRNGQSQLYIEFSDVMWVYNVVWN